MTAYSDIELLAAHRDAVTAPLTSAKGLPNVAYNSDVLFEIDRGHVLGDSWAAIAYGTEIRGPGFAKPVDFMGVPLLLVRDKARQLHVFHNVCSHRGMRLVQEDRRVRTVIRCPYHSWSYGFDGQLKSTPLIGGTDRNECDGFDKGEHGLKAVRYAVWMDIVFVNLSGDATPFQHFIEPIGARWKDFLSETQRDTIRPGITGSYLELDVSCNWKLAVENYCEAYHLPWVHPSLDSYSPLDQHFNVVDGDGMSGQGTHKYELASVAGIELPMIEGWPQNRLSHAEYLSLYPNVLLGIQADHFFSVIVIPEAPDRSVEKLQVSYVGAASSEDSYSACRATVLKSWEAVFREDVFVVEGMQAGRRSPGFDGGVLTPVQDVPTRHFHRWVAKRYADVLAASRLP